MIVLTGETHSGKTSFLKKWIKDMEEGGYSFCGILSETFMYKGRNCGYDAIDLKTGEKFPLLRTNGKSRWKKTGRYYFLPEGLKKVSKIILNKKSKKDILVIDEIGPLEIRKGKGIWNAVRKVLTVSKDNIIIVVRKSLLKEFLLRQTTVNFSVISYNRMLSVSLKKTLTKLVLSVI